ncbi:MAG: hypothetical protein B1H07_01035 [Campylobacteraceae bacterium 4484_166]|nr:MAG: hypothetical protein B1H07_01035 [Campylobacteraceae bacterium 4484_166]
MTKYDALFEDEDDIFGGTPLSKFYDIVTQSSSDVVKSQFDSTAKKFAMMEMMLEKYISEDELNKALSHAKIDNSEQLNQKAKSLLIEWTGDIVMRLDS